MKIDVYDTYAKSKDGHVIHFDVFVAQGTDAGVAFSYAKAWLDSIGENGESLEQNRCRFCHSENAHPAVEKAISEQGHFILQMEGCPSPAF